MALAWARGLMVIESMFTCAGLLTAKRVKQWTFYKRDEARIAKLKVAMLAKI